LISSNLCRRKKKIVLPPEKLRQKGERLLPITGHIYLRPRPYSMAMDDAQHHDQGQL